MVLNKNAFIHKLIWSWWINSITVCHCWYWINISLGKFQKAPLAFRTHCLDINTSIIIRNKSLAEYRMIIVKLVSCKVDQYFGWNVQILLIWKKTLAFIFVLLFGQINFIWDMKKYLSLYFMAIGSELHVLSITNYYRNINNSDWGLINYVPLWCLT